MIDACTVRGRGELLPVPGVLYRAFVDPSGGSADSMTIAVAPPAGHDRVLDLANAAAGALLLVQARKGIRISPEAVERFARPEPFWRH